MICCASSSCIWRSLRDPPCGEAAARRRASVGSRASAVMQRRPDASRQRGTTASSPPQPPLFRFQPAISPVALAVHMSDPAIHTAVTALPPTLPPAAPPPCEGKADGTEAALSTSAFELGDVEGFADLDACAEGAWVWAHTSTVRMPYALTHPAGLPMITNPCPGTEVHSLWRSFRRCPGAVVCRRVRLVSAYLRTYATLNS